MKDFATATIVRARAMMNAHARKRKKIKKRINLKMSGKENYLKMSGKENEIKMR